MPVNMPKIGDPFGPKYTVAEKYPDSPRLKASLHFHGTYDQLPGKYTITRPDIFNTDWCSISAPDVHPYLHVYSDKLHLQSSSLIQRRIKSEDELGQAIRQNETLHGDLEKVREQNEALQGDLEQETKQKALLEPTVRYALMPKLEELEERINDVVSKEEFDDLSKTLDDMSIKAGNADDRLDLVEQKTMAMGKKLDTIQRDVNEIKTMVAEIHAALRRPSSSSRN